MPPWATKGSPFSADAVVLVPGVVEVALGTCLVLLPGERRRMAVLAAVFFTAILSGDVAQLTGRRDPSGLDTDAERAVRLLFQPLLVAWALWSTR